MAARYFFDFTLPKIALWLRLARERNATRVDVHDPWRFGIARGARASELRTGARLKTHWLKTHWPHVCSWNSFLTDSDRHFACMVCDHDGLILWRSLAHYSPRALRRLLEVLRVILRKCVRKLPRQVDSSKLELPQRSTARGTALAAGFPAHRAV